MVNLKKKNTCYIHKKKIFIYNPFSTALNTFAFQVHIGKKVTTRDRNARAGDMVATYLPQYPSEWPQVGRVCGDCA